MNNNKAIIRELERVTSVGRRRDEIFDDWIDLALATMRMLPKHLKSALTEKKWASDDEETAKIFAGKKAKYSQPWVHEHFAKALGLLLSSAQNEDGSLDYRDSLGEIFQDFGHPNTWNGQFMTPFPIAEAMARMTDVQSLVLQRIKEAMTASPLAQAFGFAGLALEGDGRLDWFLKRILPAMADTFEPVTVCDPCCGSGVMFLATAASCPPWMTQRGLIHFYGCDIDATCCKMSQLNLMLYGCNGFAVQCALAMSGVDLSKIPELHRDAYVEAQMVKDDPVKLQEIRAKVIADRHGQLELIL